MKILDGGVYFQTIGSAKTKAQTGFTDWFQDFPHPANFFYVLDGKSIRRRPRPEPPGDVDDPEITKELDKLNLEPEIRRTWRTSGASSTRSWSRAATSCPYGHRGVELRSSRSEWTSRTARGIHPVYKNDYSSFCLK